MKKIITFTVICCILLQFAAAYYEGQTIKFSFNVYTNNGKDDASASLDDSFILDNDDNYAGRKTLTLTEEDETNYKGVWSGTYTIPAGASYGIWRAIGRFTNVNGTNGTDIISFFITDKIASELNISALPNKIELDLNNSHGTGNWSLTTDVSGISGMTSAQNTTLYNISNEINAPYTANSDKGLLSRIIKYLLQELQGVLRW